MWASVSLSTRSPPPMPRANLHALTYNAFTKAYARIEAEHLGLTDEQAAYGLEAAVRDHLARVGESLNDFDEFLVGARRVVLGTFLADMSILYPLSWWRRSLFSGCRILAASLCEGLPAQSARFSVTGTYPPRAVEEMTATCQPSLFV
jgi:hypothetical protein